MWRINMALLICLFADSAYSNPPPPTPPKYSEHQKKHPATSEEQPAYNPTGTDKNPFVIKSLEAEKTPERTEQERPEREEKAANEGRLVLWTIVLSIATIVLAGIAGGQLVVFGRQAARLRETVEATKDIGRKAIAAELPIVFAKEISLRQLHGPKYPQDLDPVGVLKTVLERHSEVTVRFVNYGRTPAPINSACIRHLVASGLPIAPVFEPISFAAGGGPAIKPGQESTLTFAEYVLHLNADEMNRIIKGQNYLWVYGLITFQDFLGDNHDCGFCYQWSVADPTGFIFAPATPREYNRRT